MKRATTRLLVLSVTLAFYSTACTRGRQHGTLTNFVQRGKASLAEVNDSEGRAWKVATVEVGRSTGFAVINSQGQLVILASVFTLKSGGTRAVEFLDPDEKEDALAVLDRKFLTSVSGASDVYRKWVEKDAVLTYGGAQETRVISVKAGPPGSSTIKGQGGTIIGQIAHAPCHCYENAQLCEALPTTWYDCVNKCCDFVNCITDILNGDKTDCTQEQSDAEQSCKFAAGAPE